MTISNSEKLFDISLIETLPKCPLLEIAVPAGFPSQAHDYIENLLDLNELMILNPAATYFVRVEGNSMIDANIYPGDFLIVDRSEEIADGKIVIGVIDGEVTVKRLRIKNNEYWLCPENVKYKPLRIEPHVDFRVWGVVTWVIHKPV
ncbi:MAG: translesion error-prone DNA polymerase V autoproteolytic subunit [Candidatus Cloacimonetes bacterium]|nr:translesion error-prone DNA polymerase V autoproteolytic subunit [Candidatus Cloacimonadota bacterium]